MIRHIVVLKVLADVGPDDPRPREVIEQLAALGGRIPELRSWVVGPNVKRGPRAYDFALVGDVDDLDALSRYLDHPEHRKVLPALDEVFNRFVVDLELPSPFDTP